MTEREAFVRKICEAPADDTARLVYADWLDEYGDEADHTKAKFIRQRYPAAVIGLSRQPKPAARPWATYARALFAGVVPRAWATWLVPSPGSPVWNRWWKNRTWSEMCRNQEFDSHRPPLVLALRHGFASCLGLDQRRFLNHAGALFRAQPIEYVSLLGMRSTPSSEGALWQLHSPRTYGYSWAIKEPIFRYLTGGTISPNVVRLGTDSHMNYRKYPTRADALADLSDACVAFGREMAGLPPLVSQDGRTTTQAAPRPNHEPNAPETNS